MICGYMKEICLCTFAGELGATFWQNCGKCHRVVTADAAHMQAKMPNLEITNMHKVTVRGKCNTARLLLFYNITNFFDLFGNLCSETYISSHVICVLFKFYVKMLKYPRPISIRNWTKTYHWAPYQRTRINNIEFHHQYFTRLLCDLAIFLKGFERKLSSQEWCAKRWFGAKRWSSDSIETRLLARHVMNRVLGA